MLLLEKIVNELLNESVSIEDVNDAIDNHKRVIINYHTKGENKNTGARVIEVYAYGTTKAGNPVIRAFEPYGDTTTRVPNWKFFRLDRISAWKPTDQEFSKPASFYYSGLGEFNPSGDETMATVFKIAKFGNENIQTPESGPKRKEEPYKTDTERRMERFRQQVTNPITLSDIKTQDGFRNYENEPVPQSGPKRKEEKPEIYKTDTERGMERLRQQLQNPQKIDLSKFEPKKNREQNIEKLEKVLGDEPITMSDLRQKMSQQEEKPEIYKTDTERNMEKLRQQLQNPQKIDLSKIPRR